MGKARVLKTPLMVMEDAEMKNGGGSAQRGMGGNTQPVPVEVAGMFAVTL